MFNTNCIYFLHIAAAVAEQNDKESARSCRALVSLAQAPNKVGGLWHSNFRWCELTPF